jgi:SAM-dependent methyltransferase
MPIDLFRSRANSTDPLAGSDATVRPTEPVRPLGDSPFNYDDYSPDRFLHYYQQTVQVLKHGPATVLEIGPGDHTVTDFLRRKGIAVETLDNDAALQPTYLADLREPLPIDRRYDLVLASEVFEHMNIAWLPRVLSHIREVIAPGGVLVVSVPYSTVRLFPSRATYGRVVSCEGRLHTHIPLHVADILVWPVRALHRVVVQRLGFRQALARRTLPRYPDDRFDVHHWDLGIAPTTRSVVRRILREQYVITAEQTCVDTNCVFFTLSPDPQARATVTQRPRGAT